MKLKLIAMLLLCCLCPSLLAEQTEPTLHTFERQRLTPVYYSEGANIGDFNNDGQADIVYGPHWYAGPEFTAKHEIYKAVPQNRNGYANNFFSWAYDFNGDGFDDVFTVGFPGTPAYVYENPTKAGLDKHWKKHQVFDWVSNESPHFINLVGDDKPELVCTRDGYFGYASIDWEKPFDAWTFHAISPQITAKRFGHGLGVGDVNGDGRLDIIHAKGWFEQPAKDADSARWEQHDVKFSEGYGGAEMYAYDVDGDGDNDIITSHSAHDFGLGWYEQVKTDGKVTFRHHLIMGSHPSDNRYGVLFSEPHSVNLVDIDGDGLKDIVTGKTFYSHHRQSPMWDAGSVVYWFKLVRTKKGVDWLPYLADGESGIGRQVIVGDVNADGLPDIVTGGMKGAHVLRHRKTAVDEVTWKKAQPQIYKGSPKPSIEGATALRGPKAVLDPTTGTATGVVEGESLRVRVSGGAVENQPMGNFKADRWSGNAQLWWRGGRVGDTLEIVLPKTEGRASVDMVMTCARDYGIVQVYHGDKPIGKPIDLYDPQVVTTGVLTFPNLEFTPENSKLTVQIVGANPKAVKAYMFGLDYLRVYEPKAK